MSSLPVPFGAHQSPRDPWFASGGVGEPETFTLFGIRLDSASAEHVIIALWESCLARSGLRVALADVWMLLEAQRDHTVWEALSSADYVLPVGDDLVMRGLTRRHTRPIPPEEVLFDLFDASMSNNRVVALVGPAAELTAHLPLIQDAWPDLRLVGLNRPTGADPAADEVLLSQINTWRPDLLIIGGGSPWQERWIQAHRGELDAGATLMLPALGTPLAAVAERAGLPMANLRRLRREAALRRALGTTVGQVALAPASRLGSWLREARSELASWSADLRARRLAPPRRLAQPLRLAPSLRLGEPRRPLGKAGRVQITELHDPDELHAIQHLGASPLDRLTPSSRVPSGQRPQFPALPPGTHAPFGIAPANGLDDEVADQPTTWLGGAQLREQIASDAAPGGVPLVVTGWIVEPTETTETHQENGTATAAPSGASGTPARTSPVADPPASAPPSAPAGPPSSGDGVAPPRRVPARAPNAAQLAPTQRLSARRLTREDSGPPPTRRLRASVETPAVHRDAGAPAVPAPSADPAPLTTNPLPPASTTPLPPASTRPLTEASPGDSLTAAMSPVAGRRTSRRYWTRTARRQQSRHARRRAGGRR